MKILKTKSFEIAVNMAGNESSKRLAFLLPGRLDTKDYANFPSHLEFLANRGFLAVAFDPPGTWDSPGPIELFSTTNYIKAVNELIEYFGNKQTLVMGHSRGGTVTMLAGPQNQHITHMVSVNSAYGGPIDVDAPAPGQPQISYRDLPPGTERTKEKKRFDLPYSYFEDGNQYNALGGLKNCNKPKLFFYGTQDVLSTHEIVKKMYDTASEPKMIHELNVEHDYRLHPEIIEEVNVTLGRFLDKFDG